jgi:hypothetical protein
VNPYEPPVGEVVAPSSVRAWWRRPSAWIGGVEIAAGLSLGVGGCVASLRTEASLAGVGAALFFMVGVVFLVLPGRLLLGRHRYRCLAQLLPAALGAWLLVAWARG